MIFIFKTTNLWFEFMNTKLFATAIVFLLPSMIFAQHSDILFSYENDEIVIRDGVEGFTDGFQIFEGTFPKSGFSRRFTENPGFLSESANEDMVSSGDQIQIELLESSTFGSFLTQFDGETGMLGPTDATVTIDDNMGDNTLDLVIGNLELTGDNPQFIQTADSFDEVHSHINFTLSVEAEAECTPAGDAYGILFRLVTSNSSVENSQPVWLVFNYGMSPADFENIAIPAFVGTGFLLGDVNGDGVLNLLDVAPFVDLITAGGFLPEADINGDGTVNLLDVGPFVQLLTG